MHTMTTYDCTNCGKSSKTPLYSTMTINCYHCGCTAVKRPGEAPESPKPATWLPMPRLCFGPMLEHEAGACCGGMRAR